MHNKLTDLHRPHGVTPTIAAATIGATNVSGAILGRDALGIHIVIVLSAGVFTAVKFATQNLARFEFHDLARREGDLITGLRIAAGTCVLALNFEHAEARDHHFFVAGETVLDQFDPILDDLCRLLFIKG